MSLAETFERTHVCAGVSRVWSNLGVNMKRSSLGVPCANLFAFMRALIMGYCTQWILSLSTISLTHCPCARRPGPSVMGQSNELCLSHVRHLNGLSLSLSLRSTPWTTRSGIVPNKHTHTHTHSLSLFSLFSLSLSLSLSLSCPLVYISPRGTRRLTAAGTSTSSVSHLVELLCVCVCVCVECVCVRAHACFFFFVYACARANSASIFFLSPTTYSAYNSSRNSTCSENVVYWMFNL